MYTLSMSAIQTYLRCRKKFELRNVRGWEDDKPAGSALADGTAFHSYMEYHAKNLAGMPCERLNWGTPMGEVAIGYIYSKGFPAGDSIKSVDDPHFVQLYHNCRLRTTFDLVYAHDSRLIIRDYKTFDRAPSMDIDLDFQARTYLWAASRIWPGYDIYEFEHEYVRRTLPNVVKDKSGGMWADADCYKRQQMILTPDQIAEDGEELLMIAHEIIERVEYTAPWFRTSLKGGGYDQCASCSVKNLCIAEKSGNLNTYSDYLALAVKKDDTIYAP